MIKKPRRSFRQTISGKTVKLGSIDYFCGDIGIVKLLTNDIPYTNSPVLTNGKEIVGKIDDIFGRTNDVFISVKFSENTSSKELAENCVPLEGYVEKFISKNRFKSREETELEKNAKRVDDTSATNHSKPQRQNFKNKRNFNNQNQFKNKRNKKFTR